MLFDPRSTVVFPGRAGKKWQDGIPAFAGVAQGLAPRGRRAKVRGIALNSILRALKLTKFIRLQVPCPVYVIDCIISIPAVKASIIAIAIILNGFLVNWIVALINEAAKNAAINDAGAITKGSSLVNITIVSIFIYDLCGLVP